MDAPSAPPSYEETENVEKALPKEEKIVRSGTMRTAGPPTPGWATAELATAAPDQISQRAVGLAAIRSLTQFLLGAVTCSAFMAANKYAFYPNSFSQHIYLCISGFVVLMSQSALLVRPGGANKTLHITLHMFGCILALAGFIVRAVDWSILSFPNVHSITAWLTMVLTALSFIGRVLRYNYPKGTYTTWYKKWHRHFDILTISMAFICICFGFSLRNHYSFDDISVNLSIAFTVFALAGILISVFGK